MARGAIGSAGAASADKPSAQACLERLSKVSRHDVKLGTASWCMLFVVKCASSGSCLGHAYILQTLFCIAPPDIRPCAWLQLIGSEKYCN